MLARIYARHHAELARWAWTLDRRKTVAMLASVAADAFAADAVMSLTPAELDARQRARRARTLAKAREDFREAELADAPAEALAAAVGHPALAGVVEMAAVAFG